MHIKSKIAALLVVVSLLNPLSSYAEVLNHTAISICEHQYFNCTQITDCDLVIPNGRLDPFDNCTNTFELCMNSTAYASSLEPQECYLAEAAWTTFEETLWFSVSAFIFFTLLFPMILKAAAAGITHIGKLKIEEHPIAGRIGSVLFLLTNSDGDNTITAGELISPQTLISFITIALPIPYLASANTEQAKCDYAKSKAPTK